MLSENLFHRVIDFPIIIQAISSSVCLTPQPVLDLVYTFSISFGVELPKISNGFITNGFIMHQHPNITDGIVMMTDDAEGY